MTFLCVHERDARASRGTVPAFLFHFIEEYDRLADFDAGVSLAIDLTADILLMYFTGAASVLRDLQYLKYTNNVGKALQGSLSATEAVEVWRGLEVGSEIFTVTTGELAHINQYLIATENNEKKKKILEKNQKVLLTLMMAGVGSSVTARSKAVQEADETLRLIDALPVNTPHNIPQPMIDVLTTLSGQKAITLSLFGNKLNNLELAGAANTIVAKYNMLFTDAQRLKFWNDFQHIDDPAFWKLLNSGKGANGALNGSYIDNWISLSERGLIEAKFSDYICVQRRTDALINYIDEPITKPIINTLSYERKLVFIDTFGNDLATFKNKPELINQWKRYYDELTLREGFLILNKNKQIEFLDSFGTINNYWFNRFKKQPYLFDKFNTASNQSKLLAKSNPELWIRINRYYSLPNGLGEKLSSSYLKNTYKTEYAERLVNAVETKSQQLLNSHPSRTYRDENFQLVSGMIDKNSGKISELFTNFPKKYFKTEIQYVTYRESLHPNIKAIVEELEHVKSLYNVDNIVNLDKAGHYIGAHAEIRALDDLIKKRFGSSMVEESIFNDWLENSVLGYNRNITVKVDSTKVIMPRCVDCFYITDLLTFINK